MGLSVNDKITVNDLLYGLMLKSGNDCAVALAEYVAGSVDGFAILMNQKAECLGLSNTHFETPHGLDSENHYTTAYELALLSNYALKNDTFKTIVGTKSTSININGNTKAISNTNELLGNLNGVYGIKTGFTNGANRCLVTACKRGDLDIICVVLGADTKKLRASDSKKLIEYTFSNYSIVNIYDITNKKFVDWKENNLNSFYINKTVEYDIFDISFENLQLQYYPIRNDLISSFDITVNCKRNLTAPIHSRDIIGTITLLNNNKEICSYNIYVKSDIPKKTPYNYFEEFLNLYHSNIFTKYLI